MRMKEPPNAHSHVIQFVVGTTEAIPIHEGKMTIGTFQNIIVVDADGPAGDLGSPKTRTMIHQFLLLRKHQFVTMWMMWQRTRSARID